MPVRVVVVQFNAFKFGLQTAIKCGRNLPTHLLPISVKHNVKLIPNINKLKAWNKQIPNDLNPFCFLFWNGNKWAFNSSIIIINKTGPTVPNMPTAQNGIVSIKIIYIMYNYN